MAGPAQAYRGGAVRYDRRTGSFRRWRALLVEALPVNPGDTVLDVGCGTGLCLEMLREKVGPDGAVVGIDASAQMLAIAEQRIAEHGWSNVRLVDAPVAQAAIDVTADAALFCAVHDVLQSPDALANVADHLRPGAPVAAAGGKSPALWTWPLHLGVAYLHAPFIADFVGFDRPWRHLAQFVPDLRVRRLALGTGYLALGHTA